MTTTLTSFRSALPDAIGEFRREFDTILDRYFDRGGVESTWFGPCVNVAETDDCYEIHVDLPGMTVDDIEVEVRHGDLWISGERNPAATQDGLTWHRVECRYGRFQRMIRLGDDVDADKIEAEYRNGVLRLVVSKAEVAKPRRITVKS